MSELRMLFKMTRTSSREKHTTTIIDGYGLFLLLVFFLFFFFLPKTKSFNCGISDGVFYRLQHEQHFTWR